MAAALALRLDEYTAPVRINTAEARVLERLPGIGPKLAESIIKERTERGPFRGPEDLAARIRGIGPATVARWAGKMTFRDSAFLEEK